jgi:hypothetical protein
MWSDWQDTPIGAYADRLSAHVENRYAMLLRRLIADRVVTSPQQFETELAKRNGGALARGAGFGPVACQAFRRGVQRMREAPVPDSLAALVDEMDTALAEIRDGMAALRKHLDAAERVRDDVARLAALTEQARIEHTNGATQ